MSEVVKHAQEKIFIAKNHLAGLSPSQKVQTPAHIVFNDIVKCVCLPHLKRSKAHLALINKNATLAEQYAWVLQKVSLSVSETQIAASTTTLVFERNTDIFGIKLKADPTHAQQAYVIVNLYQSSEAQRQVAVHLHCYLEQQYTVITLPAAIDNKTQILLNIGDTEYQVLTDANTRIHLT